MAYEPEEYRAIKRNVEKIQRMLRYVDNGRTFTKLRSMETVTLTGRGRFDDRDTEISISGDLLRAAIDLCVEQSIASAKAIHGGEWEANKFEEAMAG